MSGTAHGGRLLLNQAPNFNPNRRANYLFREVARFHSPQGPVHRPRKIKRPIKDVHVWKPLARFLISCIRGSRNHTIPTRVLLPKSRYHLAKEVDFAHADSMKPDARLVAVAE